MLRDSSIFDTYLEIDLRELPYPVGFLLSKILSYHFNKNE